MSEQKKDLETRDEKVKIEISDDENDNELEATKSDYFGIFNMFNRSSKYSSTSNSQMTTITNEQLQKLITDTVNGLKDVLRPSEPHRSLPKIEVPKLSMDNYAMWSTSLKNVLKIYKWWIEPSTNVAALTADEKEISQRAALFIACHLDEANASLINDSNRNCFLTAWNDIERFHRPQASTILTKIHSALRKIQFDGRESIEKHLMRIEAQFTRLSEIREPLSTQHQAAIILSSVEGSPQFESVFQSALWTDSASLTVSKVKTILLSVEKQSQTQDAHLARQPQRQRPTSSQMYKHPQKSLRCRTCGTNEHSWIYCLKNPKRIPSRPRSAGANVAASDLYTSTTPNETEIAYTSHVDSVKTAQGFKRNSPYTRKSKRMDNRFRCKCAHYL
jgi:gag-polypeptide of LTR copia-type